MNDTNIVDTAIVLASMTKERKTKKKINQTSNFFNKMDDLDYEEGKSTSFKIKRQFKAGYLTTERLNNAIGTISLLPFKIKRGFKAGYVTVRGLTCALETISLNEKELKQRKKIAQNSFGYSEDEVAREHTELVNPSSATKMYVDDIRYNAAIPLRRLSELEVIWGEAELLALHDFSYIKSLKAVVGDLQLSSGKNETGLENLEVITGDFYPGEVNLNEFKNLVHVGGKIYKNGTETTLAEVKSKPSQYAKK